MLDPVRNNLEKLVFSQVLLPFKPIDGFDGARLRLVGQLMEIEAVEDSVRIDLPRVDGLWLNLIKGIDGYVQ